GAQRNLRRFFRRPQGGRRQTCETEGGRSGRGAFQKLPTGGRILHFLIHADFVRRENLNRQAQPPLPGKAAPSTSSPAASRPRSQGDSPDQYRITTCSTRGNPVLVGRIREQETGFGRHGLRWTFANNGRCLSVLSASQHAHPGGHVR